MKASCALKAREVAINSGAARFRASAGGLGRNVVSVQLRGSSAGSSASAGGARHLDGLRRDTSGGGASLTASTTGGGGLYGEGLQGTGVKSVGDGRRCRGSSEKALEFLHDKRIKRGAHGLDAAGRPFFKSENLPALGSSGASHGGDGAFGDVVDVCDGEEKVANK